MQEVREGCVLLWFKTRVGKFCLGQEGSEDGTGGDLNRLTVCNFVSANLICTQLCVEAISSQPPVLSSVTVHVCTRSRTQLYIHDLAITQWDNRTHFTGSLDMYFYSS